MITTRIRFLKNVPPETVWPVGRKLIGAPDDYRWEQQVPGPSSLNYAYEAYPGQAEADMRLEWPGSSRRLAGPGPAAYAELTLKSPGWDLDPHYRYILRCWFWKGPVAWQEEYSGEWFTNPDQQWAHYVGAAIIGRSHLMRGDTLKRIASF